MGVAWVLLCINRNTSQINKKMIWTFGIWMGACVRNLRLIEYIHFNIETPLVVRPPSRPHAHTTREWIASTWSVLANIFGQHGEDELMAGVFLGFSFFILIFFSSKHSLRAKFHENVVIYLPYSQHHSFINQVWFWGLWDEKIKTAHKWCGVYVVLLFA